MKPFLQGRKSVPGVVPAQPEHHAWAPLEGRNQPAQPAPAAGPSVEAVKEGDKVVRLVVTCGCGERIDIECLYSA